jgi:hypothetical protein
MEYKERAMIVELTEPFSSDSILGLRGGFGLESRVKSLA